MVKFLDLTSQYLSIKSEIDDAIKNVIEKSAYIGGEFVERFEKEFSEYIGAKYCVGVGNGTDAIEIALEALKLPLGSEVIVPANSFIASSEAVSRSGHKVVFVDVDPVSYTIDMVDLERKITSATRAVIAVHLYGHPCDMRRLLQLAQTHNLRIVEDCAQAHGAEYADRRVGAFGDIATFSFYPGKNLGAYGDGGAITTNDEKLARTSRMIANHGRVAKYEHEFEGRNSRLDGLQASILSAKLPHLDSWIAKRNAVARHYASALSDLNDIILPTVAADCLHAFHLFVIRTQRRDELAAYLKDHGVQTGVHYPVALPCLKAYEGKSIPEETKFSVSAASQLLSLPIGEHLTIDDAKRVTDLIREFVNKNS